MPSRSRRGKGKGRHAAQHGTQPQQLSALAGSALSHTQRNVTTLWRALAKQLPTIRNATHYYAHDVQRLGRNVYEAAATYRDGVRAAYKDPAAMSPSPEPEEAQPPGASSSSSSDAAAAGIRYESEAHYTPASVDELGVQVSSVELQRVPGVGLVLALCIEGGFALFAVESDGVFELAVVLQGDERPPVIGVRMVDARRAVVATSEQLLWYDLDERKYTGEQRSLADRASSLSVMKGHVVVVSAEYSQVLIAKLDDAFTEVRTIISDRPVIAASPRWLAYCASTKAAASTLVSTAREEPAANSVAKTLAGGWNTIAGGLGLASAPQTSQVTLGSVTVCDVATGKDFACFNAHEHNLQHMAFDGTGTVLATASVAGTSVNVWQIMPPAHGAKAGERPVTSVVTLLYRLTRGMTSSTITSIAFSPLNAWVALATSVGTVHCYAIPYAQRTRPGFVHGPDAYVGPTLSAACRCRSAPMSKPVNPRIAFHPDFDMRANRAGIYLAAASATVCGFLVTEQGAATVLSQHLTQFSAGDDYSDSGDGESDSASGDGDAAASDAAAAGQKLTADFVWRSAIELKAHPTFPRLRNIRLLSEEEAVMSTMDAVGAARSDAAAVAKPTAASKAVAATTDAAAVVNVDEEWEADTY